MKCTWSSRCNFFWKKYLCSENHKFRFNYFWTCDFHYINIFCKKNYNDWIKSISKKFTTTGSSANFLSPDWDGQGSCDFHYLNIFVKKNYNDWIKWISKKFTTTGSTHTCNFFSIFEKNYNDWIKSFSKSRWTGLK